MVEHDGLPSYDVLCERVKVHGEIVQDHEKRIRPLERFAAKVAGMATVGGVLGGVLAALVEAIVKGHP